MPNYSKNEIVLVRYPFSDLDKRKGSSPAIVVNAPHISQDTLHCSAYKQNNNVASR